MMQFFRSVITRILLLPFWRTFAVVLGVIIIFNTVVTANLKQKVSEIGEAGNYSQDESIEGCNVAVVKVHGSLISSLSQISAEDFQSSQPLESMLTRYAVSEHIGGDIRQGEYDDNIKAFLIDIDSYGGSPYAGFELSSLIQLANKPTVSLVRGSATSSAFLIAVSSDYVIASEWSDLGSIGVTASHLNLAVKNDREGVSFEELSSGKYKDLGSIDKPLTSEDRNLILRDVNKLHKYLVDSIAEYRNVDSSKVAALADGSSFLGDKALEYKFIDKLGVYEDAIGYLEEVIGEEPVTCNYPY